MVKHWDRDKNGWVERQDVDAFVEEIISVCRKHNMSIGHEDHQGAFLIEPFNQRCINWLQAAMLEDF